MNKCYFPFKVFSFYFLNRNLNFLNIYLESANFRILEKVKNLSLLFMLSYFSRLVRRIFSGSSEIELVIENISISKYFVSRTHSNKLTSYEKPVGHPRGRNVVCQEDVSGSYTLDRTSLEMFANYKRLAAKPLISSVNEEWVLRGVTRRSSQLSITFTIRRHHCGKLHIV